MFVVFEIYEVKDRPDLAPKIPYYVIYDALKNSIFEPYRASALFDLDSCAFHCINFRPLSITRKNLKKIS